MEMPKKVNIAIKLVWATIAISTLAALANIWAGYISQAYFVFAIFIYALYCIIPYKLAKRSNPARWVFTILVAISILFMLGGIGSGMPKFDLIATFILIPIEIYILFCLFNSESSAWFNAGPNAA